MNAIIHRRRTVSSNALDRIRARISEIKRTYQPADLEEFRREARQIQREDPDLNYDEAQAELLTERLESREIETLEWVIREIFEAVP